MNKRTFVKLEYWPKDGLEAVPRCPVCNDVRRHKLYDDLTDRIFFCAPGVWALYQCASCGSAYLDPRPTPETIHLAYRTYYTHGSTERTVFEGLSAVRRVQRVLANGYRNWRFGMTDKPAWPIGILAVQLFPAGKAILDRGLRHLPKCGREGRLLDVGFGDGRFLDDACRAGWNSVGVDMDPVAVRNAKQRGLSVRFGDIRAFADEPSSFDAITMSHVIEHVHDPIAMLRQAYTLLKPGGRLWLETPNIESCGHQLFASHWRGLEPPRHLVLFSWDGLTKALNDAGFTRVELHVSRAVTEQVFAASDALSRGLDPYLAVKPSAAIRQKARVARWKSRLRWRSSEFITLVARKLAH